MIKKLMLVSAVAILAVLVNFQMVMASSHSSDDVTNTKHNLSYSSAPDHGTPEHYNTTHYEDEFVLDAAGNQIPVMVDDGAGGTIQATDHDGNLVWEMEIHEGGEAMPITDLGEVCVYCHTPHNSGGAAPLWNRAVQDSSAYTELYTSSTIEMNNAGGPTGVSLACLSCHDGTLGLDVVLNQPGADGDDGNANVAYELERNSLGLGMAKMMTESNNYNPNLTENLSDDHPVSMVYDITKDPKFNSSSSIVTAGLRLFGSAKDTVQCATCHNPHEATIDKFLRIDNAGSALCKTCHMK